MNFSPLKIDFPPSKIGQIGFFHIQNRIYFLKNRTNRIFFLKNRKNRICYPLKIGVFPSKIGKISITDIDHTNIGRVVMMKQGRSGKRKQCFYYYYLFIKCNKNARVGQLIGNEQLFTLRHSIQIIGYLWGLLRQYRPTCIS